MAKNLNGLKLWNQDIAHSMILSLSIKNMNKYAGYAFLQDALTAYGLIEPFPKITPYGSGLINHTWKITAGHREYIMQKINTDVFKTPLDIAYNISQIENYLKQYHPEYRFIAPLFALDGRQMICLKDVGYFRIFPFVHDSHTINSVESPEKAFEAASQFGRFTRMLSGMDTGNLKITIPGFHDLDLRYKQFLWSLENGDSQRFGESADLIRELISHFEIVTTYRQLLTDPGCKLRVTHHDTKISNVLFGEDGKALCVIDLDTVMPGYFISDVGDMMRTYLCPVSEEETAFDKIEVRVDFYKAIVQGYYTEMEDELTPAEKKYFFFSGVFLIYMQALRFLTDYLNNDRYYAPAYPRHNFIRAKNQAVLLRRLLEKKSAFAASIIGV